MTLLTKDPMLMGDNCKIFIDMMRKESDRGSVLVATSIIDELLLDILKAKLIIDVSEKKKDELFEGGQAPISSFHSRIELSYRLGLIRNPLRKSFHLLKRIRNDFAHIALINDFESSTTQDRVREIFNLNKEVINSIIDLLKEKNLQIEDINSFTSQFGWRLMFEILFSSIAAGLTITATEINRLSELQ